MLRCVEFEGRRVWMSGDVGELVYEKEEVEGVWIEKRSEEVEDWVREVKCVMLLVM